MPNELIAALVTAGIAIIASLSKNIRTLITAWVNGLVGRMQSDPDRITKMWAKMQKISQLVEDLKGNIQADRVSVISLHNGGLQSESGTPNYMTALQYGAHENEVGRLNFRSVEIDSPMVATLLTLSQEKLLTIETTQLDAGTLNDLCVSNHIQQSFLVELKNVPDGAYYYYFLWCQFKEPITDPVRLASIRTLVRSVAIEVSALLDTPKPLNK